VVHFLYPQGHTSRNSKIPWEHPYATHTSTHTRPYHIPYQWPTSVSRHLERSVATE